jgi:uncharacterized membrane protein
MTPTTKATSVGAAAARLILGSLIGAVVGAVAGFAWFQSTETVAPALLWGGPAYNFVVGGLTGGFVGIFLGAAGGWVWLVVAVGRESRERQGAGN